ncbi:MAG: helix-hairpin-helix domain-containing protein [Prochlorococcaceae cyanobacterium]
MAKGQSKGHWLDPLARSLLEATGQLPRASSQVAGPVRSAARSAVESPVESANDDAIEADLLALKLRQNPALKLGSAAEVRHAAALGWRLDVNRAGAADWLRLPGCEPAQVDLLLRLQAGGVQLSGPEDLARLLNLSEEQLRCWQPLLEFRWYGEIPAGGIAEPVDLNQAPVALLQGLPGLSPERSQRLVRERQRRPFRDLAELQQRLQLPAAVVEGLIGLVRFGTEPGGPSLPPHLPPQPPRDSGQR